MSGEDNSVAGEQWYEVVGMVRDFGWQLPLQHEQSAIYRPRLPAPGARVSLAVRVGDPNAFAARLRTIAVDVDPTIRFDRQSAAYRHGGLRGYDQPEALRAEG